MTPLDAHQALLGHFKEGKLAGGTETVLGRAEHAERGRSIALEIENGIDHVLDDTGTGNSAVLGDMTDQDDRDILGLGDTEKSRGDLAARMPRK